MPTPRRPKKCPLALAQTSAAVLVTCKLNCAGTFNSSSYSNNWTSVANGSLAQKFIHASNGTVTGGDAIFEFFADAGVTTTLIDEIRELGNGVLGGQYQYPDGPDVMTVFVTNLTGLNNLTRARVSWTESQG